MTTADLDRPLRTGWEPETEDSDSLCRAYLYHWAAECAAFARSAGGTVRHGQGYVVTDLRRPSGLLNTVTLLAPPADLHDLLDEIEPTLDGDGSTGSVHLWSLWPTPDLRSRGWELEGHPPLLLRPPTALVPVAPPAAPPTQVTTVAALADWERVVVDGFPLADVKGVGTGAITGPALLDDPRLRLYLSHEDGRPATASALFVAHGLATLALAATLPAARRRGHWDRHARHRLLQAPDAWIGGVFSDFSRPGAEALGFVPLVRFTLWRRPRPASRTTPGGTT
jgi:hypothetical protein